MRNFFTLLIFGCVFNFFSSSVACECKSFRSIQGGQITGCKTKWEPQLSEKDRIKLRAWIEEKYGNPNDPNYRRCQPINPPCVHFPDCNISNPTPPHPIDTDDYDICFKRQTGLCSRGCSY